MPPADIPDDIFEFLSRRIDSVPHLEALLLFLESPDIVWSAAEIAARVYVSRDTARQVLLDLERNGFIAAKVPEGFRYRPDWDEAQLMPRMADVYRKHLVQVAELIHAKSAPSAVEEFARAFRFTKKE